MEEWEWLILLIGVFAAAGAAIAAWRSAKAAEKTNLAQILMQLTDAYGSPDMLSGMLRLRDWQSKYRQDFAEKFAEMRNDPDKYAKIRQEDEDRRRYSHHFYKIWLLRDRGLVNEDFVRKVATRGQVDFLF